MNSPKERFFTVTDITGKTIEYEVLFTFESEETKKSYIVFTDNQTDETGSLITYAATYDESGENLELSEIESEKEWSLIENLLNQIEDKIAE